MSIADRWRPYVSVPPRRVDVPVGMTEGIWRAWRGNVAGTLIYRLRVEHIYQRRFDSADLATALQFSHWYIITRRPATKIVPGSVGIDDQILTADFEIRSGMDGAKQIKCGGANFDRLGELRDFRLYADGSYFSMYVGDRLIHGDAWALASLLSGAGFDVASQEVMYIGQAFGDNGSNNAWRRTQNHKKLQRVYEDHIDTGYEIFVAPLTFEDGAWTSDDHIDDTEEGPSLTAYLDTLCAHDGNPVTNTAVDLVEHSLISYFVPPYNEKLTEWRAGDPTLAMRAMRSAGFRLLQVILDGWGGLARFYSEQVPDLLRSHLISHDIPPEPRPSIVRGIAAPKLSDVRIDAIRVREGQEILSAITEDSEAVLRVFGDEAPPIRRPPGVHFMPKPAEESEKPWASINAEAHRAFRESIASARESERQANDPLLYDGVTTYDPTSGTITLGESLDDNPVPVKWPLNDPETGVICSTLVIGDPEVGKSSLLRLLILQALQSGHFFVYPSDPSGRNGFDVTWRPLYVDGYVATGLSSTMKILSIAGEIIESRRARGNYYRPCPEEPAIFVAIDDADILLRSQTGAAAVTHILTTGAEVGVGIMLVASDITRLESNPELMRALIQQARLCAMMPNAEWIMADLKARYLYHKPIADQSIPSASSVIVLRGTAGSAVGVVAAETDPIATSDEAKRWATETLTARRIGTESWQSHDGVDSRWYARAVGSMDHWVLQRYTDSWTLIKIFSSAPVTNGPAVLQWASDVISFHFNCDELVRWHTQQSALEGGIVSYHAEMIDGQNPTR